MSARSSLLKTAKNALDAVPLNSVAAFYGAFLSTFGLRSSLSEMQFARRDQAGGGLGVPFDLVVR